MGFLTDTMQAKWEYSKIFKMVKENKTKQPGIHHLVKLSFKSEKK